MSRDEKKLKKIVLVDDHIIIRNGLHELIEKLGPYEIVGEYNNGREVLDALSKIPVPDLIIMDISMPEMNGDEVVAIMNEREIFVPVLILTLSHDEQKIVSLFRSGICGYLEKNCTAGEMKEALLSIFSTGVFHNEYMAMALRAPDRQKKSKRDIVIEQLNEKEKIFLKLVCHPDEYTYEQMAGIMGVVPRTIDSYREGLFNKFEIKSKAGLVLFAVRHNLIGDI